MTQRLRANFEMNPEGAFPLLARCGYFDRAREYLC